MRKLDLYLVRQFVVLLALILIGFQVIFIIVDIFENLDKFIDNKVPIKIVFLFYIYTLPWFINIGLPMAVLIATVFSMGLLVKRNEWTAMKASGISLYRVVLPFLLVSSCVSVGSFYLDNSLVSWGNEKKAEIKKQYMSRKSAKSKNKQQLLKDLFFQKEKKLHLSISRYKAQNQSAEKITLISLKDGLLHQRIDGKKMVWIDSLSMWKLKNYSIRNFNEYGMEDSVIISSEDTLLNVAFKPEELVQQYKSPEELNIYELNSRIIKLRENGVNTTRWEVAKQFKLSFAFTSIIVMLFGISLSVMNPTGGLSLGTGMSIFVIFSYYAFIKFGQSMGIKAVLSPIVSAWMGNILFIIGGIVLLFSVRK
jgi:LPS export ABC transporter permease LptG